MLGRSSLWFTMSLFPRYIENLILFFANFLKKSCKLKVVKKTLLLIDCLEKKILLLK